MAELEKKFKQIRSKIPDPGEKRGEFKSGAGHFTGSMLLGQGGNVVLSGHRNMSFRKLENVNKSDLIKFAKPYGEFVYEETGFKITDAKDKENYCVNRL